MRILILEDEPDICALLEYALRERGHDTRSARTGHTAITIGISFRPQVLVGDWMLGDGLHGLHVATALRAVEPRMQIILVSGFGSEDLHHLATQAQVFRLFDKLVPMPLLLQAVDQAGQTAPPLTIPSPCGLIEVTRTGHLVWFNNTARTLFAANGAAAPTRLDEILAPADLENRAGAVEPWFEIDGRSSAGGSPPRWWIARRPLDEDRLLLALLHPDQQHERRNPVLRVLLGHPAPSDGWPFDATDVLVLDDEPFLRTYYTHLLERAGCACYCTDDIAMALRLFAESSRLKVVLLDYDMPGIKTADLAHLIHRLRELRPAVRIVGNSGRDRGQDFATIGVSLFLAKPWALNHLINQLRQDGLV